MLLDLHETPVVEHLGVGVLSSAKVGRTVEQSLDRNYESLLRMVDKNLAHGKRGPSDEQEQSSDGRTV